MIGIEIESLDNVGKAFWYKIYFPEHYKRRNSREK
jgi:hypothetical protein